MGERRVVRLFAEDVGHEGFLRALTIRLCSEAGIEVDVKTASARGGHGQVLRELRTFQRVIVKQGGEATDLAVIAIDANCKGWDGARKEIADELMTGHFPYVVLACPDPHIERWYMADPQTLVQELDVRVFPRKRKCERDVYKQQFIDALREAGHPVTLGGAEFASDIVRVMDLYRAAKNEPSLKACIDEIRRVCRTWRG
ncbi:hypothetical protein [Polyangium fumosum]|uniref:DUF4276 family protein n=1 Tax=Polyangium fumosum TaxID=889272 RepID=A0A4U1J3S7_9BACT|nr:hypothetical protein [Polyangium fumosum]TKD01677.1 hypothetical protein E8A74_30495 [Polyangium fumosum]